MSIAAGDKVTYHGPHYVDRRKVFTVKGFDGGHAILQEDRGFIPKVENLRPVKSMYGWPEHLTLNAPTCVPVAAPPRTIFISREELPEVTVEGQSFHVNGDAFCWIGWTASQSRDKALGYLAISEYLTARDVEDASAAALADRVRSKRRDEWAVKFGGITYDRPSPAAQKAIDHIIDEGVGTNE